ncbi:MAG: hypothetical protein A2687_05825 [Candidatus Levybacteria bacterium RIFCSPHIGHO2_01_FULL_38_26]|nr:MAG: hypothetical protein A2687_05825 [Candidatus Levybacteria bacterium RIFCSPHIGHO2_01_FULL_38_26]
MEFALFLTFLGACFMLLISLFIYPKIRSYDKQVRRTYEVIPQGTPLSQIAPEIGYVFPSFTPFPVPESKFRFRGRVMRFPLCPECGKGLVRRTGKYGEFLGCTGYPNCHFTKNVE